jgi:hypothetical protein
VAWIDPLHAGLLGVSRSGSAETEREVDVRCTMYNVQFCVYTRDARLNLALTLDYEELLSVLGSKSPRLPAVQTSAIKSDFSGMSEL